MASKPHKFKTGVAVTGTATVNADEVTTNTASQTLQNKTIDSSNSIDAAALPSNISATNIADGSVDNTEFQYLNGVTSAIQTQLDAKVDDSEKGAPNGVATLDGGGKVPVAQLPSAVMTYEGVWNASTNTPTLADGVGDAGQVYRVSVAGTQDLGSGNIDFEVGDYVIYNGTTWEKSDTTDAVASVNGQTGIVVLDTDDIAEGANLYFTDERAQDATGAMATNSSKVSLTYDDGANTLTPDIVAGSLVNADINASAAIDATKIHDGSVDNTEFGYLNGVTSPLQTQLDAKADSTVVSEIDQNVDDLITLSGVAENSTDLGTFTGTTITDNSTVKGALQELETAVENIDTGASAGDISETTFAMANNQVTPANVTGLAFANATVRSFEALVSVEIDATSDLFEVFTLRGIQKGSDWDMSVEATGDESNVAFTITSAGQIQYTSGNEAGFVSGDIKFRAITTSV